MDEIPLCRKCSSGTSVVTAYLLTCRYCKRHWHHSCLEPKMSDAELTSILRMLAKGERQETDVWACRRCFLRNINGGKGGVTVDQVSKTEGSEKARLSSDPTSSTLHGQNRQPANRAARKVVPLEILSDDDDVVMIDRPKISQATATRSTSTGITTAPCTSLSHSEASSNEPPISNQELPRKNNTAAKGKLPLRIPIKAFPSLLRSDSGEEQDEWDEIFEHYSHIRAAEAQQRSSRILRSRKPPAAMVKRLGPKAREKRRQETVQWVCPLGEARKEGQTGISQAKREMPGWIL